MDRREALIIANFPGMRELIEEIRKEAEEKGWKRGMMEAIKPMSDIIQHARDGQPEVAPAVPEISELQQAVESIVHAQQEDGKE